MRRLLTFAALCLMVMAVWLPGMTGDAEEATPVDVQEPPLEGTPLTGVFAESVSEIPYLPIEATPASGHFRLSLIRVELAPGTTFVPDEHQGAFTLFVDSGSVCYTATTVRAGTSVIASPSSDETPPAGCNANVLNPYCPRNDHQAAVCSLNTGDTIYLPQGSGLTQSGTNKHTYWNPHPSRTTIVYLAELQESDTVRPFCGGGCPHP